MALPSTDLGVWKVFANPDMPATQMKIRTILCDDQQPCPLSDAVLWTVPSLGSRRPADFVILIIPRPTYPMANSIPWTRSSRSIGIRRRSHAGTLRNGAPELKGIAFTADDAIALLGFLRALNERIINKVNERETERETTCLAPLAGETLILLEPPAFFALRFFLDLLNEIVFQPDLLDRFHLKVQSNQCDPTSLCHMLPACDAS